MTLHRSILSKAKKGENSKIDFEGSLNLRVVILGTRGFPNVQGGVEKHCEFLSTHLAKQGCDVIVITRRPYVDETITEFMGVRLVAAPTIRHKALEAFLHTMIGVFTALRYRPDILHIQAIGPGLFVPLAKLLGMKVVLTSHGSNYRHLKWGRFAKLVFRLGEFASERTLGLRCSKAAKHIKREIAGKMKIEGKRMRVAIASLSLAQN